MSGTLKERIIHSNALATEQKIMGAGLGQKGSVASMQRLPFHLITGGPLAEPELCNMLTVCRTLLIMCHGPGPTLLLQCHQQ